MYGPWDLNSLELVNGEDLGRLNRGQICHIVVSDPAPGFDIDPPSRDLQGRVLLPTRMVGSGREHQPGCPYSC